MITIVQLLNVQMIKQRSINIFYMHLGFLATIQLLVIVSCYNVKKNIQTKLNSN